MPELEIFILIMGFNLISITFSDTAYICAHTVVEKGLFTIKLSTSTLAELFTTTFIFQTFLPPAPLCSPWLSRKFYYLRIRLVSHYDILERLHLPTLRDNENGGNEGHLISWPLLSTANLWNETLSWSFTQGLHCCETRQMSLIGHVAMTHGSC